MLPIELSWRSIQQKPAPFTEGKKDTAGDGECLNIALCLVLYRLKCVNFKQNCILFFILFSVTTELLFVSLKQLKSLKRGRFTLVCSTV